MKKFNVKALKLSQDEEYTVLPNIRASTKKIVKYWVLRNVLPNEFIYSFKFYVYVYGKNGSDWKVN